MIRLKQLAIAVLLFSCLTAIAAHAQRSDNGRPPTLIADNISIDNNGRQVIARGNVEAFQGNRHILAREIRYDSIEERLYILGPITLTEEGRAVILANSAELDSDLREGLMLGARMILEDEVELTAEELERKDGRLTTLNRATITSCRVCESGKPPLWVIRVRRVRHDAEERQIYYEDAHLRVFDVPVAYLPRLRTPDPTLDRATGFLVPSLHNSTLLGTGPRIPYFIAIGDHKDLLLTPFFTAKTRTLEYRYRQLLKQGKLELEGAVANDDLNTHSTRAYLFGTGEFNLPRDFKLRLGVEAVSDDSYLLDYSYSSQNRVNSVAEIKRAKRNEMILANASHVHTLRESNSESIVPVYTGNLEYERRLFPSGLGGEIRLNLNTHAHSPTSIPDNVDNDGKGDNGCNDGNDGNGCKKYPYDWAFDREYLRITGEADWRKTWTLAYGIRAKYKVGLAFDNFQIYGAKDPGHSDASEVTPLTSLTISLPLVKTDQVGAHHTLEPIAQISWTGGENPDVPNYESTGIEFDEGNLFATSRFYTSNRRERGTYGAYGLNWTRLGSHGLQTSVAAGRVFRNEALKEPPSGGDTRSFARSSGLRDRYSNYLLAGQIRTPSGITLTARGLFENDISFTKSEARASWKNDRANIGATYIWLDKDKSDFLLYNKDEKDPTDISEWAFDASYRFARHWLGSALWRYDAKSDRSINAGLGITYRNECVNITLAGTRTFSSTTTAKPSTGISITVTLMGFTVKTRDKSYVRTCKT